MLQGIKAVPSTRDTRAVHTNCPLKPLSGGMNTIYYLITVVPVKRFGARTLEYYDNIIRVTVIHASVVGEDTISILHKHT